MPRALASIWRTRSRLIWLLLLPIVPGVTLTVAVLAMNFIGDALRDALDPHG